MASKTADEDLVAESETGLDQATVDALNKAGFDDLKSVKLLTPDDITKSFDELSLKQQLKLQETVCKLKAKKDGSSSDPGSVEDGKVIRQEYDENPSPNSELRLVIVGKTGNGKSSTANTILGKVGFVIREGPGSGTKDCKKQLVKLNGKNIKIIDTPGLSDPLRDPEEILHEISQCLSFARPGPHALLFIVNATDRFTQEEEKAYDALRRLFASHVNSYVIVVFTHFDELDNDDEKLKEMFSKYGNDVDEAKREGREFPDIRHILADVKDRYVTFSNTADKAITDKQVLKLLKTIQEVADTNANPYFEDTKTQAAAENLKKTMNDIKQKNFRLTAKEVWEELKRSTDHTGSPEAEKILQLVNEIETHERKRQPRENSWCLLM